MSLTNDEAEELDLLRAAAAKFGVPWHEHRDRRTGEVKRCQSPYCTSLEMSGIQLEAPHA